VAAGVGAGYWLDGQLGTQPWFLLGGGTLGVVAALSYFFTTVSGLSTKRQGRKR
jgi:F0F1-type ATP synthase assembly protein I